MMCSYVVWAPSKARLCLGDVVNIDVLEMQRAHRAALGDFAEDLHAVS